MRADAFGPAAVTRLACASPAPFAAPQRWDPRRAGRHREHSQALARRATKQGQAGIEPARPWQTLRGELPAAIQHNGLLHTHAPFARQARSVGHTCATPVMSCAPPLLRSKRVRLRRSEHGQARVARGHGVGPRPTTHPPPRGGSLVTPPAVAHRALKAAMRCKPRKSACTA
jgi:hypothetical protein